jgi:hypothetical protein
MTASGYDPHPNYECIPLPLPKMNAAASFSRGHPVALRTYLFIRNPLSIFSYMYAQDKTVGVAEFYLLVW